MNRTRLLPIRLRLELIAQRAGLRWDTVRELRFVDFVTICESRKKKSR